MNMTCRTLLLVAAGVWMAMAQDLPPDLAQRWLFHTCDTGDDGSLESEVRRHARNLEPVFRKAAESGPEQRLINQARDSARREYQQRAAVVKSGEGLGLDKESLALLRNQSQNDYVNRAVEDFVLGYRSRAVLGLGLTGGAETRAYLEKLAGNEQSPLRRSAQAALEKMAGAPPGNR
jgi:HEAT repeat protein